MGFRAEPELYGSVATQQGGCGGRVGGAQVLDLLPQEGQQVAEGSEAGCMWAGEDTAWSLRA